LIALPGAEGTDGKKICKSAFRCRSLSIRAGNILLTRHELHFFFSSPIFFFSLFIIISKGKRKEEEGRRKFAGRQFFCCFGPSVMRL